MRWLDANKLGGVTAVAVVGPTANATLTYGGSFVVPQVSQDAAGQLTATARTMTMPTAPTTVSGNAGTALYSLCSDLSSGLPLFFSPESVSEPGDFRPDETD